MKQLELDLYGAGYGGRGAEQYSEQTHAMPRYNASLSAGHAESPLEETVRREAPKKYKVPGMTENPCVTYGMVRRWIMDFHKRNKMRLPKGFYRRNKRQLVGMFYGMLDTYEIRLEDIVHRYDKRYY